MVHYPLGHNPGGFRVWWRRLHDDSDELLDNTHLMRMAGRFSRRVRAWVGAQGVPVIECKRGERKHQLAEDYLAERTVGAGVFLILVAWCAATVWEVHRFTEVIGNIAKKTAFVNHYSCHIMDPEWGHVTIKMSGYPPFGAQIILNGHEYVAAQARVAGIGFTKAGNCFTRGGRPRRPGSDRSYLVTVRDRRASGSGLRGRGSTRRACASGSTSTTRSAAGSPTATRCSRSSTPRNLIFAYGRQMDRVFNTVLDSDPFPAGCAHPAHVVRCQTTPRPQRHPRSVTSTGSHDRETSVASHLVQGPFRALGR